MDKKTLVINAIGGLANRMRSIASGVNLASLSGRNLKVIWRNNYDVKADFCDLFQPLPDHIHIQQPGEIEYSLKWEVPRRRNLYLSSIYQHILYQRVYSDSFGLRKFFDKDACFINELNSLTGNILISSGLGIGGFSPKTLRQLFRPSNEVERLVAVKTECFDTHTVGVHIRRTDNTESIENSPLELFMNEIDRCIQEDEHVNFFLASDAPDVMEILIRRYGNRITCGDNNASRTTRGGMLNGAADMWALSKTSKILGSYYSSYSEIAAMLGDIELKVMTR